MAVLNAYQQALLLEPTFSNATQVYQTHILNLLHNVTVITPELLSELLFYGVPCISNIQKEQIPDDKYEDCLCTTCSEHRCPNN